MVLLEQIEALLDYLEANRELALGHFNKSKEGRSLSKRCWVDCARMLNSVSANCPTKTPEEWRTYYNEFKFKTLKKIKAQKAERNATGGGIAKKINLTPTQERLYEILGRDVGDPLPNVRHIPLFHNQTSINVQGPMATASNVMEHEDTASEILLNSSGQVLEEEISIPCTSKSPEIAPEHEDIATPPQRRRRLRATRRQQTQNFEGELQAAQERLERIEERNSAAILEQAKAINRLAEAVEKVAAKLGTNDCCCKK